MLSSTSSSHIKLGLRPSAINSIYSSSRNRRQRLRYEFSTIHPLLAGSRCPLSFIATTRRSIDTNDNDGILSNYRLKSGFNNKNYDYNHQKCASRITGYRYSPTIRYYSTTRYICVEKNNSSGQQQQQQQQLTPPHYSSPTFYELVQTIPTGVKKILRDIETYRLINDASNTKINAWTTTQRHPNHHNHQNNNNNSDDSDDSAGRIPRRQREQQRRFLREIQKVAIPISAALIPIVGNVFILAIALAPRYFLSYHFLNLGHLRSFRALEYEERLVGFEDCARGFWRCYCGGVAGMGGMGGDRWEVVGYDAAGPIFGDVVSLYRLFCSAEQRHKIDNTNTTTNTNPTTTTDNHKTPNLTTMTRQHLLTLAHASSLSSPILPILPRIWIQYRLDSILHDIAHDDLLLIEEKHHDDNCARLTEEELLDACALRGLPTELMVGGGGQEEERSVGVMKECLGNYLRMVEGVMEVVGRKEFVVGNAGLFLLYLPALRHHFKLKQGVSVRETN